MPASIAGQRVAAQRRRRRTGRWRAPSRVGTMAPTIIAGGAAAGRSGRGHHARRHRLAHDRAVGIRRWGAGRARRARNRRAPGFAARPFWRETRRGRAADKIRSSTARSGGRRSRSRPRWGRQEREGACGIHHHALPLRAVTYRRLPPPVQRSGASAPAAGRRWGARAGRARLSPTRTRSADAPIGHGLDMARGGNRSGRLSAWKDWRPVGDSNPCCRRERAVSWASRRTGQGLAPL